MARITGKVLSLLGSPAEEVFSSSIEYCERASYATATLEIVLDHLLRSNNTDVDYALTFFRIDREKLARDLVSALKRLAPTKGAFAGFESVILKTVQESWYLTSVHFSESKIRTGHLLLELLEDGHLKLRAYDVSEELKKIDSDEFLERFDHIVEGSVEVGQSALATGAEGGTQPFASADALAKYGTDLTALAKTGEMDPVLGRDTEIRQVVTCLMRRKQNNPILVGEAGVGKTAVAEGLAQRIAAGDVPPYLQGAALVNLDIGLLQAGAGMKGEFEARLKQVVDEVQSSDRLVILFIDEAHTLIGAGGQQGTGDAANLLKPALARGTLRTVAATTNAEYKSFIEPDPALVRRFQVVRIEEPSERIATRMMRAIAPGIEAHHKIAIQEEAISASVELSHRYIPARQLPDKSVSLLDTAAAKVAVSQFGVPPLVEKRRNDKDMLESECQSLTRSMSQDSEVQQRIAELQDEIATVTVQLKDDEQKWQEELAIVKEIVEQSADHIDSDSELNEETRKSLSSLHGQLTDIQGESPMVYAAVDRQAIAEVVQDWTGIPVGRVMTSQLDRLLNLAASLERRVIGQNHALDAIAQNIQTSRAGLEKVNKPVGVFMFAGTSGVGKTETAKALADLMYGGEDRLITINMSEFKTPETVTTLKGPPPGYVGNEKGGILTEAVKRSPYSVVLLDEIEKAHSDVYELFFRVFDEGVMDDSNGVQVNFRNVIFILTTNAGTDVVMSLCKGGQHRPPVADMVDQLQQPIEAEFSPAFIGRVQLIPFYPLDDDALEKIVRLQLSRIARRVKDNKNIVFSYSDDVVAHIAGRCLNAESGGRAIDGILNRTLLPEISRELLVRASSEDVISTILVSVENGQFNYVFE